MIKWLNIATINRYFNILSSVFNSLVKKIIKTAEPTNVLKIAIIRVQKNIKIGAKIESESTMKKFSGFLVFFQEQRVGVRLPCQSWWGIGLTACFLRLLALIRTTKIPGNVLLVKFFKKHSSYLP